MPQLPSLSYSHRRIIGQISTHRHNDSLAEDLESLLTYNSLSHYTAIPHGTLVSLYPEGVSQLNRTRSLRIFIGQLLYSLLHPRFILFFPTFLVHLPAYLCGHLAGRYLANPEEEETQTQFKAIFGGLGFGLVSGFVGKKLSELLSVSSVHSTRQVASLPFATWLFDAYSETASGSEWRRVLGTMAIMLGTTKVFHEWHRALIAGSCVGVF